MTTVLSVKTKGSKNCRVVLSTGKEALIPKELAVVGIDLDELRLHNKPSLSALIYLSTGSYIYKKNCIDYSVLSKEHWGAFYEMSRSCLCKFVGFQWIKNYQLQDKYHEFVSQAAVSGVPYRMFQRTEDLRGGYI
jgi:hypothetical protein